ncbi:MAG: hypothetical protein ABI892_01510, partial [Flavobacterium sp.]
MKNKIIYLSAALVFALFTACKNDVKSESSSDSGEAKEYKGKEIGSEFDTEIDKLVAQMTL